MKINLQGASLKGSDSEMAMVYFGGMRCLMILPVLLMFNMASATEVVLKLGWSVKKGMPPALIFNGHRIEYREKESTTAIVERILEKCPELRDDPADSRELVVHVLLPGRFDTNDPGKSIRERKPELPGKLYQLYEAFTRPPRKVIYHQDGKALRRYIVRCSDKETANDPLKAHYWLDDQFLGTWEKAEPHFNSLSWEKQAMVDYVMDAQYPLSSSGMGLWVPQSLEGLFWKNQMTVNLRFRYRQANAR